MRPGCGLAKCGAESVWRLRMPCECLEYRCDGCRDETQRTLMHLISSNDTVLPCARCRRPLNAALTEWVRLDAEDELSLTGQLVADVESALKGIGC